MIRSMIRIRIRMGWVTLLKRRDDAHTRLPTDFGWFHLLGVTPRVPLSNLLPALLGCSLQRGWRMLAFASFGREGWLRGEESGSEGHWVEAEELRVRREFRKWGEHLQLNQNNYNSLYSLPSHGIHPDWFSTIQNAHGLVNKLKLIWPGLKATSQKC
jgi:hypothetical protein